MRRPQVLQVSQRREGVGCRQHGIGGDCRGISVSEHACQPIENCHQRRAGRGLGGGGRTGARGAGLPDGQFAAGSASGAGGLSSTAHSWCFGRSLAGVPLSSLAGGLRNGLVAGCEPVCEQSHEPHGELSRCVGAIGLGRSHEHVHDGLASLNSRVQAGKDGEDDRRERAPGRSRVDHHGPKERVHDAGARVRRVREEGRPEQAPRRRGALSGRRREQGVAEGLGPAPAATAQELSNLGESCQDVGRCAARRCREAIRNALPHALPGLEHGLDCHLGQQANKPPRDALQAGVSVVFGV
mmetsp:Transcript_18483/g.70057  ORF Transcript_18483/g.70057 Transcript_18483/m.70057 type:complete len:298 (-) Transcript_18483:295-1188(-)